MIADPRIIVVMPAYNAERTLQRTLAAIPTDVVSEVILVDDASKDNTVALARRLGIHTIEHTHNQGYGANQKTCYREALARGSDVVVMVHPDYQYDPSRIGALVEPILKGDVDAMMGSRLADGRARQGGMPIYKIISNQVLTWIENRALGKRYSELHSGFRAFSRRLLETVPFEGNASGFVFDTQIIFQLHHLGFKMGEIPVAARYADDASSVGLLQSIRYGLATLGVVLAYWLHRKGIRRSPLFQPKSQPPAPPFPSRPESRETPDA